MKKRTTTKELKAARTKAEVKPKRREPKAAKMKVIKKKPETVTVTLKTSRWGKSDPLYQNLTVPLGEDEKITLEVTINLRETDFIEIRPVRRAMTDTKGLIRDAERLANALV